jgi:hypothetical protein
MPRHVFGLETELSQTVLEQGARIGASIFDAINVVELCVFLVARPVVDQRQPALMLDQEAPHA